MEHSSMFLEISAAIQNLIHVAPEEESIILCEKIYCSTFQFLNLSYPTAIYTPW